MTSLLKFVYHGLLAAALVGAVGCGTSNDTVAASGSTGETDEQTQTTTSSSAPETTTTTTQDATRGFEVSSVVDTDNGGTLGLDFSVSVGAATQGTDGEDPGYVNLTLPVSGEATFTNDSAYELSPPSFRIEAFYPDESSVCDHEGPDAEVDGNMMNRNNAVAHFDETSGCGVEIGVLAVECEGSIQESPWPTIAPGGTASVIVDPNGSAHDPSCTGQVSPGNLIFNKVDEYDAETLSYDIAQEPDYWALLKATEACEGDMEVVISKPEGHEGECVS
jgi:hypothetical protein